MHFQDMQWLSSLSDPASAIIVFSGYCGCSAQGRLCSSGPRWCESPPVGFPVAGVPPLSANAFPGHSLAQQPMRCSTRLSDFSRFCACSAQGGLCARGPRWCQSPPVGFPVAGVPPPSSNAFPGHALAQQPMRYSTRLSEFSGYCACSAQGGLCANSHH